MGTVVQGFADLQDRLLEVRRSIGLPEVGATRSSSAVAVSPASVIAPIHSVPDRSGPRRNVGDLVLLGVAWSSFAALVLLAL